MIDLDREAHTFLPLQPAAFHILLAVADEDRHGYAIILDVAERTGGAIHYAAGRSMSALLAGVHPGDGQAFGAAVVLTGVMLVVGTVVPTLRALRIDPISAIRAE